MEENEFNNGANIDTRPEEMKVKDYRLEEVLASAAPVVWVEKPMSQWRKFPIFDQGSSGSCVAQTLKKMLGVYVWLKTKAFLPFSASHIYQRRANKPGGGMNGDDAFKIAQKGVTLSAFGPDEMMNDSEMDAVEINAFEASIGEKFAIGNYLQVPVKDIDLVASIIQETGKAVMVWFYMAWSNGEYREVPEVKIPDLDLYAASTSRHSVAAVDFTLYKGKKALIIDETAGIGSTMNGKGQRVITEEFFKARNWFVAHFMNFKFEEASLPEKPVYNFTKTLRFSATYFTDPEVVALQNCLKWEGLYPTNGDSTGYFGSITKSAVIAFQKKYGLGADGIVGPITRAKLNEIF